MTRTEELEQENAALRRENARLRKDKVRLDWIEKENADVSEYSGGWAVISKNILTLENKNPRAAIDAAIRHQKKEGKG